LAGAPKPSARDAFDDNLADARTLVAFADALRNRRVRRMRRELRERFGEAMGVGKKEWDSLDCIESDDLFAIFKPGSQVDRESVEGKNLRPLLRQALVAACAAVETFTADRVMELWASAVDSASRPSRLLAIPMTVEDWLWIDENYTQGRRGLRRIAEAEVRQLASPAPSQVGTAFSVVGQKSLWKRVDSRRKVGKGKSEETLEKVNERRNRIAHQGDRLGVGRAAITVDEVRDDLDKIESIVDALDKETRP
jgi:hypothetical protein